ncbi:hypothetical protein [Propionibacterium australiense]|uniref:hypothetical protein n=1 Tax=Propionibacterium australiense TaxID=119981 RepID=UPI0011C43981|nr:hypothetical protein [Propionibacterium australiense]
MSAPQQPGIGGTERPADWAGRPARPVDGWQPSPQAAGTSPAPDAGWLTAPQHATGWGPLAGQGGFSGSTGQPTPAVGTARRSTVTVIVIAAVLLAMIIGAIVLSTTVGSNEGRARRVVEMYLTAVANGDAEKARGYLGEVDDGSLLTEEVLRASNDRAPMTDISVGGVAHSQYVSTAYQVQVSYMIGGEAVSTTLDVSIPRKSTSAAKAITVTSRSSLGLSQFRNVDITVNGVTPDTGYPAVFPGSYELAVGGEYLEITGGPIAATDPSEHTYSALAAGVELAVSEAGVQMFREKVIAEATECLASTSLDPGCGIEVPRYPKNNPWCEEVREDSVHRWQEPEEAAKLQSITPEPDALTPTTIQASPNRLGYMRITVTCRTGDTWAESRLPGVLEATKFGIPSIDLTDPELPIVWDR